MSHVNWYGREVVFHSRTCEKIVVLRHIKTEISLDASFFFPGNILYVNHLKVIIGLQFSWTSICFLPLQHSSNAEMPLKAICFLLAVTTVSASSGIIIIIIKIYNQPKTERLIKNKQTPWRKCLILPVQTSWHTKRISVFQEQLGWNHNEALQINCSSSFSVWSYKLFLTSAQIKPGD